MPTERPGNQRPYIIEQDFPIEGLNEIASREATGQGTKHIYRLLRWWARRPGNVFRAIIMLALLKNLPSSPFDYAAFEDEQELESEIDWRKEFWGTPSNPGAFYRCYPHSFRDKIILDPFMGGGTTVIEALKLGVKVIGVDLNPVAWFIAKTEAELSTIDLTDIERAFHRIEDEVASKIRNYYKTSCPRCLAEGRDASQSIVDVMYVFWVRKSNCARCNTQVRLLSHHLIAKRYRAARKNNIYVCPVCYNIFDAPPGEAKLACPAGHSINASKTGDGETYTCPSCERTERVIDAIRRQGQLPHDMFAIEYHCRTHGRGFKKADPHDQELYESACHQYEKEKEKYTRRFFPEQEIPLGDKTRELLNYGYKLWIDLFNPRQLLCLGTLLDAICCTEDARVREGLLLVFVDMLQANCMLTRYDTVDHGAQGLLALHGFWSSVHSPIENNVWGISERLGTRNFITAYVKFRQAGEELAVPYEKYPRIYSGGKTSRLQAEQRTPSAVFAKSLEELKSTSANVLLLAQTAEDLSFITENETIDAVITDPPYYENVQYSELSDFFYVWLHKALRKTYPEQFGSPLTPKAREIVVNESAGKGRDFYVSTMTGVLKKTREFLKSSGLLVMTFHHTQPESWEAMFTALLESQFYVIQTFPVHSENLGSKHSIQGKERTQMRMFDTVIVARERTWEPHRKSWDEMRQELYLAAEKTLRRLERLHPSIGPGDRKTVVVGKLMEAYSRHHPMVYRDGKNVTVGEVIREAFSLADEFIVGQRLPEVDGLSQFYISSLLDVGSIVYDDLLKMTQPIGITVDELKRRGLIEGRGRNFYVRSPTARGRDMESGKLQPSLAVDSLHYLYFCHSEDRPVNWEILGSVHLSKIEALLRYLERRTKDSRYGRIREHFFGKTKPNTGLDKYVGGKED